MSIWRKSLISALKHLLEVCGTQSIPTSVSTTFGRCSMGNTDRRRLESEHRVLQCRSPCCNLGRWSIYPNNWKGRKERNCELDCIVSSRPRVVWKVSVFFFAHTSIHFKLTKALCSEAQRALGFTDYFKKIKPETQDWLTNTVCVSIVLHLKLSLNGDVYISTRHILPNLRTRCLLKRSISLCLLLVLIRIVEICCIGTKALLVVLCFSNTSRFPRQWLCHRAHEYWLSEGRLFQFRLETSPYLFSNS